jgi:CRISPR/Cas system CSM-associated protein Csm3 (group 7 of RAMP superfamily)
VTSRTLTIAFSSALHHGSGFGRGGLVDRTILRDAARLPYLAGSSIKGRFRHAVLRVLLARGEKACQVGDHLAVCKEEPYCALCELFGSTFRQGGLIFTDARLDATTARLFEEILAGSVGTPLDTIVRSSTAIDRESRTVRPHFLFTSETLPPGLTFSGRILGEAGSRESSLQDACKVLTHFGADGARGLGHCEYKLT